MSWDLYFENDQAMQRTEGRAFQTKKQWMHTTQQEKGIDTFKTQKEAQWGNRTVYGRMLEDELGKVERDQIIAGGIKRYNFCCKHQRISGLCFKPLRDSLAYILSLFQRIARLGI